MRTVEGGVTAAKGFLAAGVRCGIKQQGRDLAIIHSPTECAAAGVFTTNAFKAASVLENIELIGSGRGRTIVANSGNANACTGERGRRDVARVRELAAGLLGVPEREVFNASTGIIGVPLPMDRIEEGIRAAVAELSAEGGDDAAAAIMTTDTRTKTSAREIDFADAAVRIGGMCKGAGMICPNMATMLCFVTTDAAIDAGALRGALASAVEGSFNSLTVDGDMSTNDCVIALANGESGCPPIAAGTPEYRLFEQALAAVCADLARAIAADGEGATKLVEVRVSGARSYADAKMAAMAVANSALVKTAVFGQDPNWGRVLCAVGRSGAYVEPQRASLWFGDVKIVEDGEPLGVDQAEARGPMLMKELTIAVDLGVGSESASVLTCDFSYDYVKINAEYHT